MPFHLSIYVVFAVMHSDCAIHKESLQDYCQQPHGAIAGRPQPYTYPLRLADANPYTRSPLPGVWNSVVFVQSGGGHDHNRVTSAN